MFASTSPKTPQQPVNSLLQSKRQNFHNEIRRKKRNEYKQKIRAKMIYGNQLNYDLLHKIDLNESMKIISTYPSTNLINEQKDIDDYNKTYVLDSPQNQKLKKAIQDVYLYVSSSMSDHALHLLQQTHIFRLAQLIDKKLQQLRPLTKEKSLRQIKKKKEITLPLIYEKMLMILTHWSYDIMLQDAYLFLIYVLNKLIQMFPLETRIIQCATHCLANSFDKPKALEDIMRRLNQENLQNCVLSKIVQVIYSILSLQIFQFQTKNFDNKSYHSCTVITSILHFYGNLFRHVNFTFIFPQMKRKIYQSFHRLLTSSKLSQEINLDLLRTLMELYSKNFGPLSHILLETKQIFMEIVDLLSDGIAAFNSKQIFQKKNQKKQILAYSFEILKTVFQDAGSDQDKFDQACEFLSVQVEGNIDLIMQQGLRSHQNQIITDTLELIKYVCLWGDFIQMVEQNNNVMIKLFYYCQNQNIKFKKQAMLCLFNIIEGYFDGKNYYDAQLCAIYETFFERFRFLETLVANIDIHYDKQLNLEILNCVKIMCMFWQADPQYQRQNIFWIKFVQYGGQLKLNRIVSEVRNQQIQQKANEILQLFANNYQIQI